MNPGSQNPSNQQSKQNIDQSKTQFPGNPGVGLPVNSFITSMQSFPGSLNGPGLPDYSPYLMTGVFFFVRKNILGCCSSRTHEETERKVW